MTRTPALLLVFCTALVVAGCGGGGDSLGTVPRAAKSGVLTQTPARPVSVRLRGAQPATAHLQRAARGQKTRVTVALASAGGSSRLTAEIAIGSCSKPTALTSTSVLGPVRGSMASWTTPTPFAQLAAARAAVVLRSARRPVVACGNVPRR